MQLLNGSCSSLSPTPTPPPESLGGSRNCRCSVTASTSLPSLCSQDSGDGTGKRRSDNGEDGVRWKLTDEPAQNKKKSVPVPPLPLPSAEETQVQAGALKRKKDKELPAPDTGPKKKVSSCQPSPAGASYFPSERMCGSGLGSLPCSAILAGGDITFEFSVHGKVVWQFFR